MSRDFCAFLTENMQVRCVLRPQPLFNQRFLKKVHISETDKNLKRGDKTMKKHIKALSLLLASVLAATMLTACETTKTDTSGDNNAEKKIEEKQDFSGVQLEVGAYRDLRTDPYNNSYSIGADKFMEDNPGSNVTFIIHKNNEELVTAIAANSVWDVQMSIMSPIGAVFNQNIFSPIDDYIDINNPIYTKELIETACKYDGHIYGISNVMMSDVLYAIYNENMYKDYNIKTPHEYYAEGNWSWDGFLTMIDDLKKNQLNMAIEWEKPYLNRRYGVVWNDDYTVSSMFDSQQQRDWLGFVRTVIYDKGMTNSKGQVANRENAFRLEILPHILVAATGANPVDQMRYIPWVTKDGKPDDTYIVDYYFCLPNGAKNAKASIALSNEMIQACIDDRTKMYKEGMTEEDFNIFKESINNFYTIASLNGYYPNEKELITNFTQGMPVSQYISENKDRLQQACDDHNKLVQEKKAAASTPAATK